MPKVKPRALYRKPCRGGREENLRPFYSHTLDDAIGSPWYIVLIFLQVFICIFYILLNKYSVCFVTSNCTRAGILYILTVKAKSFPIQVSSDMFLPTNLGVSIFFPATSWHRITLARDGISLFYVSVWHGGLGLWWWWCAIWRHTAISTLSINLGCFPITEILSDFFQLLL